MQPTLNQTWLQRNSTNFTFQQSISHPSQKQPQNFRTKSKVGSFMKDEPQKPIATKKFTLNDKIAQVNKDLIVPRYQTSQYERNHQQYHDFLNRQKKFKKPYAQCTKYVDNLMKNKALLRRGPFQVPIEPSTRQNNLQSQSKEKLKSEITQSNFFSKKQSLRMKKIKSYQESSDKKKGFDKTLTHYSQKYKLLMKEDRTNEKQKRFFKNSMDRILAAEMIKYRVLLTEQNNKNKKFYTSEN